MESADPFSAIVIYLTPNKALLSIALQVAHSLQGLPSALLFSQFNAFATISAKVVLPVPAVPANKYAVGKVSSTIAFLRDFTIES